MRCTRRQWQASGLWRRSTCPKTPATGYVSQVSGLAFYRIALAPVWQFKTFTALLHLNLEASSPETCNFLFEEQMALLALLVLVNRVRRECPTPY